MNTLRFYLTQSIKTQADVITDSGWSKRKKKYKCIWPKRTLKWICKYRQTGFSTVGEGNQLNLYRTEQKLHIYGQQLLVLLSVICDLQSCKIAPIESEFDSPEEYPLDNTQFSIEEHILPPPSSCLSSKDNFMFKMNVPENCFKARSWVIPRDE